FVRAKDVDMNQQRREIVQYFSGCGNVLFFNSLYWTKEGHGQTCLSMAPVSQDEQDYFYFKFLFIINL
ncbi:MAG: hypothetical protein KAU38_12145, partial [Desulfobacterales bacterium]|nr:hypothetical protein [Desulfobacterales bacterium]